MDFAIHGAIEIGETSMMGEAICRIPTVACSLWNRTIKINHRGSKQENAREQDLLFYIDLAGNQHQSKGICRSLGETEIMKKFLITASIFIGIVGFNAGFAGDEAMHPGTHHHEMNMMDARTSLGLSAEMKQHQLKNMRGHVEAIRSIVGLMAESKFEDASKIAHAKLGLTPEMQEMCNMFDNKDFKTLGLSFHKSGDDLGDALQTKDVNVSLRALNRTMQYCVECHATYRQ